MRAFALTYPQLMNQAIGAGVAAEALARLRATHDVAQHLADGVYRPHGQPFLCHLVRTASIVLAEGQPLAVVQAGLVHAAYDLRRAGAGTTERAWLRRAIGDAAEALVFAYYRLPWNSAERLDRHVERLDGYDETTRRAVLMRLANELEDHLDRAAAYASVEHARRRRERRAGCLALARTVGSPALVDELEAAFDGQLDPPLPPVAVIGRDQGYALWMKRWPELSSLRGAMRDLLRRLHGRSG